MSEPGDTLTNRQLDEYRVLALLGQGGMARVYLGEDVRLKRYVAIKVIDRPFREEPAYIERFEREAQAIARLEHPHIVRLYRYGETERLLYMAMQYVEGADLGMIMDSYSYQRGDVFMPPQEALAIVRDVGAALDYAHRKEVIHRDIKPSNILLDRSGQAFLTDFGLALLTTGQTLGESFGTPQYISPEQAGSSEVGPQSDLYSLGVVLFEMFTGSVPFSGGGPLEVALRRLHEPPPDPRQRRPELDPAIAAVILKALAREPEQRYQSGAALTSALETALAGRPLTTVVSPTRSLGERVTEVYDAHGRSPAAMTRARPGTLPTSPARPAAQPATSVQPAAVVPAASAPAVPADREAMPSTPRRDRRRTAVLWGASLLLLLCLVGALGLLSNWGGEPEEELVMPAATSTPGASRMVETPTAAPPAQTPTLEEPSATVPIAVVTPNEAIAIVTRGDDSLFLVNATSTDLRLAGLQLGEGENAVRGVEWEIVALAPGECVTVWKQQGNPEAPDVSCEVVGARVTRHTRDIFWRNSFPVYYRDAQVAHCDGDCVLSLP